MEVQSQIAQLIARDFDNQHIQNLQEWKVRNPDLWELLHQHYGTYPLLYAYKNRLWLSFSFVYQDDNVRQKMSQLEATKDVPDALGQELIECYIFRRFRFMNKTLTHLSGVYRD